MSMTEEVHAIVSDGQEWTAGEIARALVPRCDTRAEVYQNRYNHVYHSLRVLEMWGRVERVGTKKTVNNQTATVWRAVVLA